MLLESGARRLVTFDQFGIDGHSDHIAVFNGARKAVKRLRSVHDYDMDFLVLDSHQDGGIVVPATAMTRPRKLEAISMNRSQMLVRSLAELALQPDESGVEFDLELGDGFATNSAFWEKMRPYRAHIDEGESYRQYAA